MSPQIREAITHGDGGHEETTSLTPRGMAAHDRRWEVSLVMDLRSRHTIPFDHELLILPQDALKLVLLNVDDVTVDAHRLCEGEAVQEGSHAVSLSFGES